MHSAMLETIKENKVHYVNVGCAGNKIDYERQMPTMRSNKENWSDRTVTKCINSDWERRGASATARQKGKCGLNLNSKEYISTCNTKSMVGDWIIVTILSSIRNKFKLGRKTWGDTKRKKKEKRHITASIL